MMTSKKVDRRIATKEAGKQRIYTCLMKETRRKLTSKIVARLGASFEAKMEKSFMILVTSIDGWFYDKGLMGSVLICGSPRHY